MYVYAKANSYTRWCQACNNKMCLVLYCNENLQIKLPTNFIAMKFSQKKQLLTWHHLVHEFALVYAFSKISFNVERFSIKKKHQYYLFTNFTALKQKSFPISKSQNRISCIGNCENLHLSLRNNVFLRKR